MERTSASVHDPVATPARYAAPSAVVSEISGTTTGTPSTSAWNFISQPLTTAPPSAFSSSSTTPEASSIARSAGQMGAPAAAGEPDDGPARVRIPVRRAEAREGRHEVDAVVRIERAG